MVVSAGGSVDGVERVVGGLSWVVVRLNDTLWCWGSYGVVDDDALEAGVVGNVFMRQ